MSLMELLTPTNVIVPLCESDKYHTNRKIIAKIEIFIGYLLYLCIYKARKTMAEKNLNRLKVVLAEKNLSNKWLSEQLGVGQATISKWVTNTSQPNLEMLLRLSDCLEVPLEDLVRRDGIEIKK